MTTHRSILGEAIPRRVGRSAYATQPAAQALPTSRHAVVSFGRSYGRGAPRPHSTQEITWAEPTGWGTKRLLCPLLEACPPARHLFVFPRKARSDRAVGRMPLST
nr:hypothetical protein [Kibdelosporangium sp. MJ126-NF4]CTQ90306.1 hypothetical protein [Kibdelosporangium sp. MJ126-NF4]